MGGDIFYAANKDATIKFQSTHPHGVRRNGSFEAQTIKVSIHAPTWGATLRQAEALQKWRVSIHAPTWGATSFQSTYMPTHLLFQSTHPHGVRLSHPTFAVLAIHVSIHAPTWGATQIKLLILHLYRFQSTHPHGVRPITVNMDSIVQLFQSTHPHGVRLKAANELRDSIVSIHAPTWGATYLIHTCYT